MIAEANVISERKQLDLLFKGISMQDFVEKKTNTKIILGLGRPIGLISDECDFNISSLFPIKFTFLRQVCQ